MLPSNLLFSFCFLLFLQTFIVRDVFISFDIIEGVTGNYSFVLGLYLILDSLLLMSYAYLSLTN
jgi:hypothetical protein